MNKIKTNQTKYFLLSSFRIRRHLKINSKEKKKIQSFKTTSPYSNRNRSKYANTKNENTCYNKRHERENTLDVQEHLFTQQSSESLSSLNR